MIQPLFVQLLDPASMTAKDLVDRLMQAVGGDLDARLIGVSLILSLPSGQPGAVDTLTLCAYDTPAFGRGDLTEDQIAFRLMFEEVRGIARRIDAAKEKKSAD